MFNVVSPLRASKDLPYMGIRSRTRLFDDSRQLAVLGSGAWRCRRRTGGRRSSSNDRLWTGSSSQPVAAVSARRVVIKERQPFRAGARADPATDLVDRLGFIRGEPSGDSCWRVGMTEMESELNVSPGPVCVITRLEFPTPITLLRARLMFGRLRRLATGIDGFLYARCCIENPKVLMLLSIWDSELSMIKFTTLEEHVQASRWTIFAKGQVWSAVFEHRGVSSRTRGWLGRTYQWRPTVAAESVSAPDA